MKFKTMTNFLAACLMIFSANAASALTNGNFTQVTGVSGNTAWFSVYNNITGKLGDITIQETNTGYAFTVSASGIPLINGSYSLDPNTGSVSLDVPFGGPSGQGTFNYTVNDTDGTTINYSGTWNNGEFNAVGQAVGTLPSPPDSILQGPGSGNFDDVAIPDYMTNWSFDGASGMGGGGGGDMMDADVFNF